jgi:gluconolactonase
LPVASSEAAMPVPEIVANLVFGGAQRNMLFITATTSVYALRVNVTGGRYPLR